MSALNHRRIPDSDVCAYCLEDWPCTIGKVRIELATAIREIRTTPTGHPSYEEGRNAGLDAAADLVGGVD